MMRFFWPLAVMLIGSATLATPALAKDIVVQMKNRGQTGMMVFEPAYVQAAPGDKIHFVPTDMAHNAETIPGMVPAGVSPAAGAMNKEFVLTATKPGLYGIKCLPHYGMGMVALVKVGKGAAPNAAAATAGGATMPPLAKKKMVAMLDAAK